jgi:hypothetical protein
MSASATAPRPASVGRWGGRSADTSSRQSCSRHTPQWRAEFVPCSPSGLAVSADGRGVHLMELRLIDCVSLIPLRESDSHIITNLMQLYKYDFSVFAEVGSQYGEVGRDGRFTYEGLESYWREEGRLALRVEADERLAGFVLVDRWSALNRLLDHAVAEFFVLRKYRRVATQPHDTSPCAGISIGTAFSDHRRKVTSKNPCGFVAAAWTTLIRRAWARNDSG